MFEVHPETKIFHLAKIRLFAEIRPRDTHLMASILLNPVFFQGQQDFAGLMELMRSESLEKFLEARDIRYFSSGRAERSTLDIYFK